MEAVGFVGTGVMGTPMATRLLQAGTPLTVWNRTAARTEPLAALGARVAGTVREVFERSEVVLLMLVDEAVTDSVLGRGTESFADLVRGRLVVQAGTTTTAHSVGLGQDVTRCGGRYVEAPVSGSRGPAEAGTLVGMLAGAPQDVAVVRRVMEPLCAEIVDCGPVPAALSTKLAANLFLLTLVAGLAEAFHLGERSGVDPRLLEQVLAAGPSSSTVSRTKADKMVRSDWSVQAALPDVLKNCRLVAGAAQAHGVPVPVLDAGHRWYAEAVATAGPDADMAAVLTAMRHAVDPTRG